MPPTTTYKRGDVVLVPFPFTDLSNSKQRPALVVSPDNLNAVRDDVILVAISSQLSELPASDEIIVRAGDLASSGLLKPSAVKTAKMFTIHQGLIRKKIGTMPTAVLQRVLRAIQETFHT